MVRNAGASADIEVGDCSTGVFVEGNDEETLSNEGEASCCWLL